jgi:hypothetical protein
MAKVERDITKEAVGWLQIVACMVAFPVLFFLCVFFPMWIGATPSW